MSVLSNVWRWRRKAVRNRVRKRLHPFFSPLLMDEWSEREKRREQKTNWRRKHAAVLSHSSICSGHIVFVWHSSISRRSLLLVPVLHAREEPQRTLLARRTHRSGPGFMACFSVWGLLGNRHVPLVFSHELRTKLIKIHLHSLARTSSSP